MTLFDQKVAVALNWFKRRDLNQETGNPKPVKDGGLGTSNKIWTTLPRSAG